MLTFVIQIKYILKKQMLAAEAHIVIQISWPKGKNYSLFNLIVFSEKIIG